MTMTTTRPPLNATYDNFRVELSPRDPDVWDVIADYHVAVIDFHSTCRVAAAYTEADAKFIASCYNAQSA